MISELAPGFETAAAIADAYGDDSSRPHRRRWADIHRGHRYGRTTLIGVSLNSDSVGCCPLQSAHAFWKD